MPDERFARQLQRERVTTTELWARLRPVTGEAFAGDELGGAGLGEGAEEHVDEQLPPTGARQATLGGLRPTSTAVVRAGSDGNSRLRSQPSTSPNRS